MAVVRQALAAPDGPYAELALASRDVIHRAAGQLMGQGLSAAQATTIAAGTLATHMLLLAMRHPEWAAAMLEELEMWPIDDVGESFCNTVLKRIPIEKEDTNGNEEN